MHLPVGCLVKYIIANMLEKSTALVLQHQDGNTHPPKGDAYEYIKYCIIFGAVTQAEHPFRLAVIFVPVFQYNTKGR